MLGEVRQCGVAVQFQLSFLSAFLVLTIKIIEDQYAHHHNGWPPDDECITQPDHVLDCEAGIGMFLTQQDADIHDLVEQNLHVFHSLTPVRNSPCAPITLISKFYGTRSGKC